MKKITGLLLYASFALCLSAAPDGKKKSAGEGKGFPSREEMMKKFDKDGDGKLNEEERNFQFSNRPNMGRAGSMNG